MVLPKGVELLEPPLRQVEGLAPLLAAIPKDDLADYGFESEEQLQAVQLEEPFQLHTIPIRTVSQAPEDALSPEMSATAMWYFPISVGGKVRSLLIAEREGEGDTYRAVGIGRAELAAELALARAQWPVAEGHRLTLVSVLQPATQAEFVLREGASEARGLAPLASARRALGESVERAAIPALRTLEPAEVMARLKGAAEAELGASINLPRERAMPERAPVPPPVEALDIGEAPASAAISELPKRKQLMSCWCWAAMVQAMLARHDLNFEQCYLVQWSLDAYGPNPSNACGNPNATNFLETGVGSHEMMLNWGVPGSIFPRALNWSEIKREINSGNPVVRRIAWPGGGHYTVVRGYSVVNVSGITNRYVSIMDPSPGDYLTVLYSKALKDGTTEWADSRVTEFIGQSSSQGVVGFSDSTAQRIYAFVRGDDKCLYVNYWDGGSWQWANQGTPPGSAGSWDPAVVTYRDGGTQRISAFITGENKHLYVNYWDGAQWLWADQGKPGASFVSGGPSAVVFKEDYPDYNQGNAPRVYVFVRTENGHLQVNYWNGSTWQWADQGTPPGATVDGIPAAITFRRGKVTQIHVYMKSTNGTLCANWWDGGSWQWGDLGKPAGTKVLTHPHVITYKEGDQVMVYAFVQGENGHLYVCYHDGSWHWADQGTPPGTTVNRLNPGVITYRQDDHQRIYAFVTGHNGHLYVNYWDGSAWHWADQGVPPGTQVAEQFAQHPGAYTYRRGNTRRLYAFVMGANGRLYVNHWDGSEWRWRDQNA